MLVDFTAKAPAERGRPDYSLGYLRSAALFSNLSDAEIACFRDAAQLWLYKKDKVLYLEDEAAGFFYVIRSGWIKLFHTTPEGEEVIVDMLAPGDMAGEDAIFEHDRHTSSAQIVEDACLLSIPLNLLKAQIRLNPALALAMLSSMSLHHRRHYDEMAQYIIQNAPQRIGCFLLRLCPKDEKTGISFHLPYDKTLIAQTLGMNIATFSRALNILREKTAIRINGARVEIDSVKQLMKFVHGSFAAKYAPEKRAAYPHAMVNYTQSRLAG